MAGLTMATADAVLKEDYRDALREQINTYTFITSQIEKNTEDVAGRRALMALHTRRNSGVGARKEYGNLPTASKQGYADVYVPLRFNYGRIELSGPVIKAMNKDRGSFIRAVRSETDGIRNDTARDVNRQIWGTADGVIAQCGSTTTANLVVLASTTTTTQIRQLWADGGSLVDIGTVATPTSIAAARNVTAYTNPPSPTITIDGAVVSTTAAAFVFRAGAGGGPGTTGTVADSQSELTGLGFIVAATGTLFTLAPATEPSWASYVDANGGTLRAPAESLINKAMHETELVSGAQVDLLVGSAGVSRNIASSMQAMRRNVDNVNLEAGYQGIQWSTVMEGMRAGRAKTLVWDRDAPANALFGLSRDHLVEFVEADWDWMDDDGAVLSRVSGKDAYEATFYKYHELATDQRNAHFRVSDLIEA